MISSIYGTAGTSTTLYRKLVHVRGIAYLVQEGINFEKSIQWNHGMEQAITEGIGFINKFS